MLLGERKTDLIGALVSQVEREVQLMKCLEKIDRDKMLFILLFI